MKKEQSVRRKREALTELKARFDQINSALEELSDIVTKNEKNKAANDLSQGQVVIHRQ